MKTAAPRQTTNEGSSFAQKDDGWKTVKGKKNKKNENGSNKKYWKDKECCGCGKKGHPASYCPDKEEDVSDNASVITSIKKLSKELKSVKKQFTAIKMQLETHKEESDMSGLEDEGENVNFQCEPEEFQFAQLVPEFDLKTEALLKQSEKDHPKDLDLRRVWLLDSKSTINLFCD